jgi:adenine-specific DNA-methyltransferase
MKFKAVLLELLKTDNRLLDAEGELMGNKIQDLADKTDEKLIELLLDNSETRMKFFLKIKDVFVFKTSDFKFYLDENKIDNSYTQYENRIGLTSKGKFLKDSNDIVLDFPYKDCILEGGQSTEEGTDTYFEWDEKDQHYTEKQAKRKEIFFNNVLAKDEIDRLLEPKAFTNTKRYTVNGIDFPSRGVPEGRGGFFTRDENGTIKDNLIIKGNNLLALHTLKKEFAGKVKLIYIDPPYNTGNDSFAYNDNFNHSTWLTFMRNRLLVARELLREDGVIFVQNDSNEFAALKILMDEIFQPINYIDTIISRATPNARDYGHIGKMHEYIHLYSKNIDLTKTYLIPDLDKKFSYKDNIGDFNIHPLYNSNVNFNIDNRKNLYYPFYINPKKKDKDGFLELSFEKDSNSIEVFPPKSVKDNVQFVWRWGKPKSEENLNIEIVGYKTNTGEYRVIQKMRTTEKVARSIWDETEMSNRRATEDLQKLFGEKIFSYPKSEYLLKRVIEMSTAATDIVLDYHLGSGTTASVAHKMNRQYIGIEQMDYVETVAVERLKKVIDGEQGGISKSVNWQGGGSFVYLELAKNNQNAIEQIQNCKSYEELTSFFDEMCEKYFLHYNVKVKQFREEISKEENFKKLSLDNQKELFIKMLDLNQLYVNVSDMEDNKYNLSADDIAITKDFYQL